MTTRLHAQRVFGEEEIVVVEHSVYSPDLAPCDFFLFPTMKNVLKGTNFDTMV
jgi:hypothetical protein